MDSEHLGVSSALETLSGPEAVALTRKMEELGYGTLWIGEAVVGRDPFAMAAYLLAKTERIKIGLCVANVWKREAATTINAARTLASLFENRFVLGVGVSHQKFVDRYGMHYEKPYQFMREYVARMKAAPFLGPKPKQEPPIMIAAQMPLMMKLARETDGVFVTFAPPELTARARAVMGPERRVYVIQAFTLHTDPAKARAIGRQYTAFYSRLPNYRNCLMSMGFGEDDFANGGSDRLIDAIVAWGSEEALHDRLQAQFKAGADHVNVLALSDADAGSGQSQADEAVLRVLAPGWNRTSAP
ncbi:MAG: TIGR03620 family F420-dependent LLM class oxidoreductase [Candidatus Binataceae bacterium]